MKKAVIISTRNPNELLLEVIKRYKEFYKDFDIIIIDSNSFNTDIFKYIPNDVIIDNVISAVVI